MNTNLVATYIADLNRSLDIDLEDGYRIKEKFIKLISLEKQFAASLRHHKGSKLLYENFAKKINRGKNISMSKHYFRVKYDSRLKEINSYIAKLNVKELQKLPINFLFCQYAMKNIPSPSVKLSNIYLEIKRIRQEIIEQFLYLGLNQATTWQWSSGTKTAMEDLIQIANEVLVESVDKYVVDENSTGFHNRVMAFIIYKYIHNASTSGPTYLDQSSEKLLLKIRQTLSKDPNKNSQQLAEVLNVKELEVVELMGAIRPVYIDQPDENGVSLIGNMPSNEKTVDTLVEENDLMVKMKKATQSLSFMQKKVLKLKGVKVDE